MWIVDGLLNAARMAWEVWCALVLGFLLSRIVQAWVPRGRIEPALGGRAVNPVAFAAELGGAHRGLSRRAVTLPASPCVLTPGVHPERLGAPARRRERARRADRRRAPLRLLDREPPARRGALGRRHFVRRRDRVHLRRTDHP